MTQEAAFRAAASPHPAGIFVTLMILTSETGTDYYAFSDYPVDHQGETYQPTGFQWRAPAKSGSAQATILRLDNVTEEFAAQLQSLNERPEVKLFHVLLSDPDNRLFATPSLKLGALKYEGTILEAQLGVLNDLDESVSSHSFSPADWPGIYAVAV